jgi:hypothetical protein
MMMRLGRVMCPNRKGSKSDRWGMGFLFSVRHRNY